MAEFFGHMKEKRSQRVEIKDMDAAILGAMLCFIYTDSASEPKDDGGVATAQHLLVRINYCFSCVNTAREGGAERPPAVIL